MGAKPYAFSCRLLEDLRHYLTPDQLAQLARGEEINPDATLQQFAAYALGKSHVKKIHVENTSALDAVALEKFRRANYASGAWCPQPLHSWQAELVGSFKRELDKFWLTGPAPGDDLVENDQEVLRESRVGPGSAVSARGEDFYTKLFDSPLGCTDPSLYRSYKRYIATMPIWQRAEEARSALYGDEHVVRGSRLTFVPKNDQTSRTICVEPNLNVLFQIGFGRILSKRLRRIYGIDLEVQQERNRVLARRGSRREWRGSYATLDLESASDSISANMLWHMLPEKFLYFLERYRCKETEIPSKGWAWLGMISSMGNGFTFPLQTILFSAMVVTVYRSLGLQLRFPRGTATGNFGVNGDDIVVRRMAVPRLMFLLSYLGFTVNKQKSFVEGPFRESCGGDYFRGHNVRGVYVKSLDTEQARYVAINRLVQFSARTGIFVPRAVAWLLKRVTWRPVPWFEDDASGVKTSIRRAKARSARYQSPVYWALVPPHYSIRIDDTKMISPKRTKRRSYNPDGLFVSILHGSVRAMSISVRQDGLKWRQVRRIAPNWEYASAPRLNSEMSWGGLEPRSIRFALSVYNLD